MEEVEAPVVLPLCKNQLEHEGGAFWCNLPIGHAGPHERPGDDWQKKGGGIMP